MTDGIARAMSAGCQSPLAPSDEGAVTEGDWGENGVCQTFCAFVSPSVSLTLATSALHAPVCALGCLVRGRQ